MTVINWLQSVQESMQMISQRHCYQAGCLVEMCMLDWYQAYKILLSGLRSNHYKYLSLGVCFWQAMFKFCCSSLSVIFDREARLLKGDQGFTKVLSTGCFMMWLNVGPRTYLVQMHNTERKSSVPQVWGKCWNILQLGYFDIETV